MYWRTIFPVSSLVNKTYILSPRKNASFFYFCVMKWLWCFSVPRYVPPEQAKVVASVHASISGSSNSSTSSTPEVRPLKSLLGESAPSLHLNKNTPPNQVSRTGTNSWPWWNSQPCRCYVNMPFKPSSNPMSCVRQSPVVSRGQPHQQQFHDKKFDLLSDLGGDIFAAPPNMNAGTSSGFANFAHFNSHTSKRQTKTITFVPQGALGTSDDHQQITSIVVICVLWL